MHAPQDQLVELVRQLEQQNHVFSADPILITEKLQTEPTSPLTKLHHRASRIDADGKLLTSLQTIESRIKSVIALMTIFWLILGFVGIIAIMQTPQLNFFYVLASILGFHTLMLVLWLGWLVFSPRNKVGLLASLLRPTSLVKNKDVITQSAVQVYENQLQQAGFKWYISRISHQFWLASLTGMLVALVFMLLVKNYTFTWESTLLQNTAVVKIVEILSYLPNVVGFPTPTPGNILEAQTHPQGSMPIIWFRWAMLLIGSLIMYGIVPRFVLWLLSVLMVKSSRTPLDIKQPYYQKILDYWQRGVIDPDDSPVEAKPVAPVAKVSQAKKLVALLEYPYPDEHWYQFAGGHNFDKNSIDYFGILDDRDDMEKMAIYLQHNAVQVLLGIPPNALPDRGTMRKLDKIASLAKGGLIVQLLDNNQAYLPTPEELTQLKLRREQWETALAERQIGVVRM